VRGSTVRSDLHFSDLDVKQELINCRKLLKLKGVKSTAKNPYITPVMPLYGLNITLYRKILNTLKQTGILQAEYRLCGLTGIMELKYLPDGKYTINLNVMEII
jgi:hypothetical protein